jgi:hypothetical protein
MSKRKRATASKQPRSRKIVTKAQRAAQAIIRGPKDSPPHFAGDERTELPPKTPEDSQREALSVGDPIALQDGERQTMADSDSQKLPYFS